MYICICNAVKEKDIIEKIKEGNSEQEIIGRPSKPILKGVSRELPLSHF